MAAQADLGLFDGQTVPVAHIFNPKGAKSLPDRRDVAIWRDQTPASAVGYLTLTETHTPTNVNGMEKFRFAIDVPTLESAGSGGTYAPPPKRAYGSIAVIEVWVHERASQQELKDIVAYCKNFAAHAYFANAITKREAAW